MTRLAAEPWRFDSSSYLDALSSYGHLGLPECGDVSPTLWEPALQQALNASHRAVYEELVIEDLLADLG